MRPPELPDLRRAAERRLQANKGKNPGPDLKGFPGGFRRSIPVPIPTKRRPGDVNEQLRKGNRITYNDKGFTYNT